MGASMDNRDAMLCMLQPRLGTKGGLAKLSRVPRNKATAAWQDSFGGR